MCLDERGIPKGDRPGWLSGCGWFRILKCVWPESPAACWVEPEGWVWCWAHGARRVRLATLILLESEAA